MEENRIIRRVGHYTTSYAAQEDCINCHDAKWGTVLIEDLCLDCYVGTALKALICSAIFGEDK